MEDDVMQDVYTFFAGERVNVELMFRDDLDMGPLITCRLRPWKNQPHDGEMILAGGLSVDEALFYAVRGLLSNDWLQLEWGQRARVPGRYLPGQQANFIPDDKRRARLLSNALFSDSQIESTASQQKVSQNGTETQISQPDLKLLRRQTKP